MNSFLFTTFMFTIGIVLGTIFYGGLWLTVRKINQTRIPFLWFFGSFILRASIVMICFYFIAQSQWENIVTCLVGFVIARYLINWITRLQNKTIDSTNTANEA